MTNFQDKTDSLKICFMGGNQVGLIGVLTALSNGSTILSAVSYSENLTSLLNFLNIPTYKSIEDKNFIQKLSESDLLLSVHGREVVGPDLLKLPRLGGVNIHPYLYNYKGANPIERALRDKNFKASVGAHVIEEQVDQGRVLVEEFVMLDNVNSPEEVYNRLYPYYTFIILKTLNLLRDEKRK